MSSSEFDAQKHHRRSIRLPNYDYCVGGFVPPTRYAAGTKPTAQQPGAYFVTIVAWQRECLFGDVVGAEMKLNKYGLVAKQQWERLPKRFPNLELGAFVIMPNHMHGIIVILAGRGTAENLSAPGGEIPGRAPTRERFQKPVQGSIPTIVRSYKSAVSYRINLMRGTQDVPVWQATIMNISFAMKRICRIRWITSMPIHFCGNRMMKILQTSNLRIAFPKYCICYNSNEFN